MLELLNTSCLSKALLSVIVYFTSMINADYPFEFDAEVNFHNSYFFDNQKHYESLDSAYLSRAMTRNLNDYDKNTVRLYVNSGAAISLAGFMKGRMKRIKNEFKIDIATRHIPDNTKFPVFSQGVYLGSVPYYSEDTAYMADELKELYRLLGADDYFALFTFCHEISHWTNLIEAEPVNYSGVFFVKKDILKSEEQIDEDAEQMMIENLEEIKELIK